MNPKNNILLNQEEDLLFFDAHEEMEATASDDSNDDSFFFNVWNGCPESVAERRRKFLEWMGVDEHGDRSVNSGSVSNAELELNRAEENRGEFDSSSRFSSRSNSCINLSGESELRVDENIRGCNRTRVYSSSMASSSNSRYDQRKETEKQTDIVGLVKSFRKGWLGRVRSMGCATDDNVVRSGQLRVCSRGFSRVKVKQCRKRVKELSALYQGQDIKAHDGSILKMRFSNDGKYLASAGEDGVIRIWKVTEEKRLRQRDCPQMNPSCMYFEVNDLSQLKPVVVDDAKKKTVKGLKKTSDSACIIFPSKVFRILEKPLYEFYGHSGEILDISWSENNYLLSASMDKSVRLWRLGNVNCLGVFPHNGYVTSVQFNPSNENYFMSGSIDGKVRVWEISRCKVVDWVDTKDIISVVCYRKDGQSGIIGYLSGNCRFFNVSEGYLELDSQIHSLSKKKSGNKRITEFKFLPHDPNTVLVVSADSQVRILHGNCEDRRYESFGSAMDSKHIISASEDSNVYIWNINKHEESESFQIKKIRSFERFSTNASAAATWSGFSDDKISRESLPFASPSGLSLREGFAVGSSFKGRATWPEENLPASPLSASTMHVSHYKFLKASYQSPPSSLAWGMVVVAGGSDGRIRTFQNFGLPVVT